MAAPAKMAVHACAVTPVPKKSTQNSPARMMAKKLPNQSVPPSREEGEKITKRVEVKLWKDRPLWDKQPQLGWWLPFWIRLVSDLDILYDCV